MHPGEGTDVDLMLDLQRQARNDVDRREGHGECDLPDEHEQERCRDSSVGQDDHVHVQARPDCGREKGRVDEQPRAQCPEPTAEPSGQRDRPRRRRCGSGRGGFGVPETGGGVSAVGQPCAYALARSVRRGPTRPGSPPGGRGFGSTLSRPAGSAAGTPIPTCPTAGTGIRGPVVARAPSASRAVSTGPSFRVASVRRVRGPARSVDVGLSRGRSTGLDAVTQAEQSTWWRT